MMLVYQLRAGFSSLHAFAEVQRAARCRCSELSLEQLLPPRAWLLACKTVLCKDFFSASQYHAAEAAHIGSQFQGASVPPQIGV